MVLFQTSRINTVLCSFWCPNNPPSLESFLRLTKNSSDWDQIWASKVSRLLFLRQKLGRERRTPAQPGTLDVRNDDARHDIETRRRWKREDRGDRRWKRGDKDGTMVERPHIGIMPGAGLNGQAVFFLSIDVLTFPFSWITYSWINKSLLIFSACHNSQTCIQCMHNRHNSQICLQDAKLQKCSTGHWWVTGPSCHHSVRILTKVLGLPLWVG